MAMKSLVPFLRKPPTIRRREEEYPFYSLQREVNNLFGDFMREFELAPWTVDQAVGDYAPSLDMHETEKEIEVSTELPGVDEKDVNVSLSKDILTISGEKKSEKKEDAKGHYKLERTYGSFCRSVMLPTEVDADRTQANFKNGVLTITLPKTAESQKQAKSIPVKKG